MSHAYKKLNKQIPYTAVYKVLALIFNYTLIALLVDYLGQENFGIYVALTSLFTWMFLFDLGIAKGMRNFVTIAISNKNIKEAKEYVSTAYISILILTIICGSAIISLIYFIDLKKGLNINLDNNYLNNIFVVLILGFFVKFYLSTVDQLNFSTHQSQNVALNTLLVSVLNVIGIFILWKLNYTSSVKYAVVVFSASIILPYLYSTTRFFYKYKDLIPSVSNYSNKALNNIFKKGSKILFIQIAFLLIIGIDRLILLKYGNALEVSKYEIIYKIMSLVMFPVSIINYPLWSSFTEAYAKDDKSWIKSIFKKLYLLILGLLIAVIALVFLFNIITSFWLTGFPHIDYIVIFTMGFMILSHIWCNFHTDFLLGIQHFSYAIVVIFIGLALKFCFLFFIISSGKPLDIMGIVISSILAYSLYNISVPFYIKRLLH
jgi:O-antigen/teichoic acid export membrane protein